MPASSASRLSPEVKKPQLKPEATRPFSLRMVSQTSSWSESLRSASGRSKVRIRHVPGAASVVAADSYKHLKLPTICSV